MKLLRNISFTFAILVSGYLQASIPLFKVFPQLEGKVAYQSLGDFPTALIPLENLSEKLGCTILCKRDDSTGPLQSNGSRLIGGNKVRKLEFVLGDAVQQGKKVVLTFGCAGSNHALATTCYAKKLGITTRALLGDQPTSWVVRRNLLLHAYYGTDLVHTTNRAEAALFHRGELRKQYGSEPYVIPLGASMPLGTLGYINAVFELQGQCDLEKIDAMYVPSGSFGTVVGLLIGLQLAGYHMKVRAIAVEPEPILQPIRELFEQTREFLVRLDKSFEAISWQDTQLEIYDSFSGEAYGASTKETAEAIALFENVEKLVLEDTYSAKAAAAVISDARSGKLVDKSIIFLHTFYGEKCQKQCDAVTHRDLPKEFHQYFNQ